MCYAKNSRKGLKRAVKVSEAYYAVEQNQKRHTDSSLGSKETSLPTAMVGRADLSDSIRETWRLGP